MSMPEYSDIDITHIIRPNRVNIEPPPHQRCGTPLVSLVTRGDMAKLPDVEPTAIEGSESPVVSPRRVVPILAGGMRFLPGVAGLWAICVGCVVLVGWLLNIEVFKRVFPGFVAMN